MLARILPRAYARPLRSGEPPRQVALQVRGDRRRELLGLERRERLDPDDVANAVLGMALGLFLSAFATSEFQAVQFMPAFVLPQILLGGLLVPRDRMARALELVSDALPLTYAYDALARATTIGRLDGRVWLDLAVIGGAILLALGLGAGTLRRRTA